MHCCCSVTKLCLILFGPMDCSMPTFPVLHYLLEFAQSYVHQVDDAIQPSHPLSLPSPPALNLSQHQGIFQWVSSLHQVAKYWSFSFSFSFSVSINPSSEYSGLISFRTDWFDLAKGLSRLFSSISLKASVFQHSAFFMVHFSHPYMITGKTIALTTQIFVGKVMSLLFNTVWVCHGFSSKEQESFDFMAAVTGGSQENKISHCFHFSPSICHEVMGWDVLILVFQMLSFKPALSLSSFALLKRLFSSSWLSAIRVLWSAYLRLLVFVPATLIPVCDSSSWMCIQVLIWSFSKWRSNSALNENFNLEENFNSW